MKLMSTKLIYQSQIRQLIQLMGFRVESVRLVRDKQTGISKGFGFVKFVELQQATEFISA
jgi:RNA recognition motif-containing protein